MSRKFDVVRINPEDKPIYLVIEAFSPDDPETTAYWYDEGTCPTNVLKLNCEKIIVGGDTDPHGLFEYVRTIARPEFLDRAHNPDEEWKRIVPEAFE